jgi:hypothetical protein
LEGNAIAAALRSSSKQQQQASKQQPPKAPNIASRLPQKTSTSSRSQPAAAGAKCSRISSSSNKPRKPFLRRLLRALIVTGASAGLLAAGAWAGSAAYRHYMAQLDDREQLARRVAELKKQEEKLVLR